jgi:hypothetical protein
MRLNTYKMILTISCYCVGFKVSQALSCCVGFKDSQPVSCCVGFKVFTTDIMLCRV